MQILTEQAGLSVQQLMEAIQLLEQQLIENISQNNIAMTETDLELQVLLNQIKTNKSVINDLLNESANCDQEIRTLNHQLTATEQQFNQQLIQLDPVRKNFLDK